MREVGVLLFVFIPLDLTIGWATVILVVPDAGAGIYFARQAPKQGPKS